MGGGRPLDAASRAEMERGFRFDFSHVRVHADDDAARSARDLHAAAYTVGQHIVFAAGQYRPSSGDGRRLLAHELAHVVQQSQGARVSIQRQPEKERPEAAEIGKAREHLAGIEKQWSELSSIASGDAIAAEWVKIGGDVVRLLREHTEAAIAAMSRDGSLFRQLLSVIETDLITYQYVSWHAFMYQNLGRIRPWAGGLLSAFKADDRAFTGRAKAEEKVRLLKKLADSAKADSARHIKLVRTDVSHELTTSAGGKHATRLTSAADKSIREAMKTETEAVRKLEASVELVVNDVNAFLDVAFDEGLDQAVEALEEYYRIKQFLDAAKGSKKEKKEAPQKKEKQEKQPEASKKEKKREKEDVQPAPHPPIAPPEPDDDERRCAIPVNLQEAGWKATGGKLQFAYTYGSSTGKLEDLASCRIWENVTYPGGSPFVWPDPPWDDAWANPTVHPMVRSGSQGKFVDDHLVPNWAKTLAEADVRAVQFYFYECPCKTGNLPVGTPDGKKRDRFEIRRRVLANKSGGTYRYVITKSGGNAQINPIVL
jgi:hypothetical protein